MKKEYGISTPSATWSDVLRAECSKQFPFVVSDSIASSPVRGIPKTKGEKLAKKILEFLTLKSGMVLTDGA